MSDSKFETNSMLMAHKMARASLEDNGNGLFFREPGGHGAIIRRGHDGSSYDSFADSLAVILHEYGKRVLASKAEDDAKSEDAFGKEAFDAGFKAGLLSAETALHAARTLAVVASRDMADKATVLEVEATEARREADALMVKANVLDAALTCVRKGAPLP